MMMRTRMLTPLLAVLLAWTVLDARGAEPVKGYQAKVKVEKPTRLDWTFVVSNQSVEKPPANWLGDYDSAKQTYELFVPANYDAKKSYPVVLFISPGNGPAGWKEWEPVCKKEGIIFASPNGAGNNTALPKRVRIVLDVLDDIRRTYNTDPDRTYLSGHSGGARIAGAIAFALPEHFGGILPSCAGVELREEPWLRQRAVDRLSVGLLTGDGDFNRGECERFRGPLLAGYGVRTKVWVGQKVGHAVPAAMLPEAYRWMEEGLAKRRDFAKKYPTSRIAGDAAPGREEWAKLLLKEGKDRLQAKESIYSGLMQLKGCMTRWNGLPAAGEAKKLLLEYDAKADKPWEQEDIAEQRRFIIVTARGLSDYASGPLPEQYVKDRKEMAEGAIKLWAVVIQDGQDAKAVEEAKKRIPALQKLAEGKDK